MHTSGAKCTGLGLVKFGLSNLTKLVNFGPSIITDKGPWAKYANFFILLQQKKKKKKKQGSYEILVWPGDSY